MTRLLACMSGCRNHIDPTNAEILRRLEKMPNIAEDVGESVDCRTCQMQGVTATDEDIVGATRMELIVRLPTDSSSSSHFQMPLEQSR